MDFFLLLKMLDWGLGLRAPPADLWRQSKAMGSVWGKVAALDSAVSCCGCGEREGHLQFRWGRWEDMEGGERGDTLESAVSLLTDILTLEQPFPAWCLASQSTHSVFHRRREALRLSHCKHK